MNWVKFFLIAFLLSLCANVFLLLQIDNPPIAERVAETFEYGYNSAFPAVGNSTNSTTAGNLSVVSSKNPGLGQDVKTPIPTTKPPTPPPTSVTPKPTVPVTVVTTPLTVAGSGKWMTYNNEPFRFSLEYPPDWIVTKSAGSQSRPAVTFTAPGEEERCSDETTECYKFIAVLSVDIDTNPYTIVLEEYFNQYVSDLQLDHGITATSKSAPTTLSGSKAYSLEYYGRDARGNPTKNYLQYFIILDKKVYILTYSGTYSTGETVYSRNKGDAQKMIESFTVDREYKVV